ncbi:uncharacterized protein LOC133008939 [Limanda limanda]|uniref:uncharacterized protein LOC133008939 n=1 Tax=Limanda limanda TaxID=27771 RepID=UPI0029C84658|nr:uncharacterized protein LOC133008939 [Limanda limanda]
MDVLTLVLLLSSSRVSGFLITVAPWRFCLTTQSQVIVLEQCDVTNPAHQWAWTGGGRLVHTQSSWCLWPNGSPQLPPHTRLTKLSACSGAPGWSCTEGAFGLAETHVYLKKLGSGVVVEETQQGSGWRGSGWRGSGWRRFDVDAEGNKLLTSLCPDTDSAPFYSSTREPQRLSSSARRPATTQSTHNHKVSRCVTAPNITDSQLTDSHATASHATDSQLTDSQLTDSHVTDSHVTNSQLTNSQLTDSHVTSVTDPEVGYRFIF